MGNVAKANAISEEVAHIVENAMREINKGLPLGPVVPDSDSGDGFANGANRGESTNSGSGLRGNAARFAETAADYRRQSTVSRADAAYQRVTALCEAGNTEAAGKLLATLIEQGIV